MLPLPIVLENEAWPALCRGVSNMQMLVTRMDNYDIYEYGQEEEDFLSK